MKPLNLFLFLFLVIFLIGATFLLKNEANKKMLKKTPKYISLKYKSSNMRTGPDKSYPIIIVFHKADIPLKVLDTYKDWYQVVDASGNKGWVFKNIVSTKRSAIIIRSNAKMHFKNKRNSKITAIINKNNIAEIKKCDKYSLYCKIKIKIPQEDFYKTGWVLKTYLWGNTSAY